MTVQNTNKQFKKQNLQPTLTAAHKSLKHTGASVIIKAKIKSHISTAASMIQLIKIRGKKLHLSPPKGPSHFHNLRISLKALSEGKDATNLLLKWDFRLLLC